MPYFGTLGNGPQYSTLLAYYEQMDEVIDHSFGEGFLQPCSVWQVQAAGLTSPGFLDRTFESVRELARTIEAEPKPILIHGDMLPTNLIYAPDGNMAIDWDECRANWWVYEVARSLFYYPDDHPEILKRFLAAYGDDSYSMRDIKIAIRLEHVRQHLRVMCIGAFNLQDRVAVLGQTVEIEEKIDRLLYQD
jgi:thiamine kinase-like enzyme